MNKLCSKDCREFTNLIAISFAIGMMLVTIIGVSLLISKDSFLIPELWNLDRYQIIMGSGLVISFTTFFIVRWIWCRHCLG